MTENWARIRYKTSKMMKTQRRQDCVLVDSGELCVLLDYSIGFPFLKPANFVFPGHDVSRIKQQMFPPPLILHIFRGFKSVDAHFSVIWGVFFTMTWKVPILARLFVGAILRTFRFFDVKRYMQKAWKRSKRKK